MVTKKSQNRLPSRMCHHRGSASVKHRQLGNGEGWVRHGASRLASTGDQPADSLTAVERAPSTTLGLPAETGSVEGSASASAKDSAAPINLPT